MKNKNFWIQINKQNKPISLVSYFLPLFLILQFLTQGCFFGFESMQEPRNNPLDPLYHAQEGRLTLYEPQLVAGEVKVLWKLKEKSIVGSDFTFTVYHFSAAQLESVIETLNKGNDPSSLMNPLSPQPKMDTEKDAEFRYFVHSTSVKTYYVVKFLTKDSEDPNFSNIVVYEPN